MGINNKFAVITPKNGKRSHSGLQAELVWNENFTHKCHRMLQDTQTKLDLEVMRQLEAYMPLDSGAMIAAMRHATDAGSGQVVVNTPYARKVYYSPAAPERQRGALRGPRYFDRMKVDKKDYLLRFVQCALGGGK